MGTLSWHEFGNGPTAKRILNPMLLAADQQVPEEGGPPEELSATPPRSDGDDVEDSPRSSTRGRGGLSERLAKLKGSTRRLKDRGEGAEVKVAPAPILGDAEDAIASDYTVSTPEGSGTEGGLPPRHDALIRNDHDGIPKPEHANELVHMSQRLEQNSQRLESRLERLERGMEAILKEVTMRRSAEEEALVLGVGHRGRTVVESPRAEER